MQNYYSVILRGARRASTRRGRPWITWMPSRIPLMMRTIVSRRTMIRCGQWCVSSGVVFDHGSWVRQRPSMHRITGTRYLTSLAWTWRRTCHRKSVSYVRMIWQSQSFWPRRSTTLANWYVVQLTMSPELRLSLAAFWYDAYRLRS